MQTIIGVTGVHGSGKSTLAHNIADEISERLGLSVGVGDEVARDCPHPVGLHTTRQAQDWIFDAHKRMEDELACGDRDVVVFDRLLMDNVLYTLRLVAFGENGGTIDNRLCAQMGEAIDRMGIYDLVIRTHYNPDLCRADDKRPADPTFAVQVESFFDAFAPRHVDIDVHDVRDSDIIAKTVDWVGDRQ